MLRATARLHLNEMPYPPPADVLAAARRCLSDLHRYTDAEELDRLREQLAEYSEVPKRRVVLSPGSDLLLREIIHIIEERERLRETLDELGARVYPSSTNFLLVRTRVPDMAKRLGDVGVLVSDVSNQLPPGFIRVSVGAREENDAFLATFLEIREIGE